MGRKATDKSLTAQFCSGRKVAKVKGKMRGIITCRFCGSSFMDKPDSTGNFLRHVKARHPADFDLVTKPEPPLPDLPPIPMTIPSSPTSLIVPSPPVPALPLLSLQEHDLFPQPPTQDSTEMRILQNLVVECGLPLNIVEKDGFNKFVRSLWPQFQPISQETLASLIPRLLQQNCHLNIKEEPPMP
ncbi:hypothetical protein Ciccas_011229 [Cichlidogyrus casuarinus]|uniref:BED-type domain-containing protein n=1 Tax=Cichlidogyrus casuarinus TaxID=1844966 RepID=A0ABD2PSI1_9PLAT